MKATFILLCLFSTVLSFLNLTYVHPGFEIGILNGHVCIVIRNQPITQVLPAFHYRGWRQPNVVDWPKTTQKAGRVWMAHMPMYYLSVLSIILYFAILACDKAKIHYRKKHGLCIYCNYDLRASPHRCPECGHDINKPDRKVSLS